MRQDKMQTISSSAAARGWKADPLPASIPQRRRRRVKAELRAGNCDHGACCSPATGPVGDAANKDGGEEVMLGVLGQRVPKDADDPQSSQGNGAGANPGAAPKPEGVGDSQKTRSTVRYKVPLFDTGRTVEVAAYGIDHIMAPLEAVDSTWMRAVLPEAPTGGLEAASG